MCYTMDPLSEDLEKRTYRKEFICSALGVQSKSRDTEGLF